MHPRLENIKAILCCPFEIIGLMFISCFVCCNCYCDKNKGYEEVHP